MSLMMIKTISVLILNLFACKPPVKPEALIDFFRPVKSRSPTTNGSTGAQNGKPVSKQDFGSLLRQRAAQAKLEQKAAKTKKSDQPSDEENSLDSDLPKRTTDGVEWETVLGKCYPYCIPLIKIGRFCQQLRVNNIRDKAASIKCSTAKVGVMYANFPPDEFMLMVSEPFTMPAKPPAKSAIGYRTQLPWQAEVMKYHASKYVYHPDEGTEVPYGQRAPGGMRIVQLQEPDSPDSGGKIPIKISCLPSRMLTPKLDIPTVMLSNAWKQNESGLRAYPSPVMTKSEWIGGIRLLPLFTNLAWSLLDMVCQLRKKQLSLVAARGEDHEGVTYDEEILDLWLGGLAGKMENPTDNFNFTNNLTHWQHYWGDYEKSNPLLIASLLEKMAVVASSQEPETARDECHELLTKKTHKNVVVESD